MNYRKNTLTPKFGSESATYCVHHIDLFSWAKLVPAQPFFKHLLMQWYVWLTGPFIPTCMFITCQVWHRSWCQFWCVLVCSCRLACLFGLVHWNFAFSWEIFWVSAPWITLFNWKYRYVFPEIKNIWLLSYLGIRWLEAQKEEDNIMDTV